MTVDGVRLPPRLPIGKNIKNETDHGIVNKNDKSIKKVNIFIINLLSANFFK